MFSNLYLLINKQKLSKLKHLKCLIILYICYIDLQKDLVYIINLLYNSNMHSIRILILYSYEHLVTVDFNVVTRLHFTISVISKHFTSKLSYFNK